MPDGFCVGGVCAPASVWAGGILWLLYGLLFLLIRVFLVAGMLRELTRAEIEGTRRRIQLEQKEPEAVTPSEQVVLNHEPCRGAAPAGGANGFLDLRGQSESAMLERRGGAGRLAVDPRRGAAGGERDGHAPPQGAAAAGPGRPLGASPGAPGGMERTPPEGPGPVRGGGPGDPFGVPGRPLRGAGWAVYVGA